MWSLGLPAPSSEEQSLNNPPAPTQAILSLSRPRSRYSTEPEVRQTGV